MKKLPLPLFLSLLIVDVAVMLFYKWAELSTTSEGILFFLQIIAQPTLWMGLFGSILQLFLWTRILAVTPLSLAYPAASLAFPLTMLAAQLVLHEQLNLTVWLGGLLITIGVAIIGTGGKEESKQLLPQTGP